MEIKGGKAKEIWGRKFRIVKNGLDEREVFSFISSLIDQNNEYARKQGHFDSLVRLAESIVIEADKQAESMKVEIEEKANEKATAIIREAEEKTKAEAERIISDAEKGSQERISAAEQLAQDIIKLAEAEVEKIKASAKVEATKIASAARQQAEESAKVIRAAAEEQGQDILGKAQDDAQEIKEKAEREALITKQEAEQLLLRSQKVAESEIREKFAGVYREMVSTLDLEDIERTTARSMEQEIATREPYEPDAAASAEVGATIGEAAEQQRPATEEQVEEVGTDLYEGMVVLTVPPPIDSNRILQLHRHLRSIPQVQSLDLGASKDRGIMFSFFLEGPTPLLKVLGGLPEIDKVEEAGKVAYVRQVGDKKPVRELILAIRQ